MAFEGTCHCGQVTFTVDADVPTEAMNCNCSYCRHKGLLLAFFPEDKFKLSSGETALASYTFNKRKINHQFCTTCGDQPFASGADADGVRFRAVNVRCVPAVNLDVLALQPYDGASA